MIERIFLGNAVALSENTLRAEGGIAVELTPKQVGRANIRDIEAWYLKIILKIGIAPLEPVKGKTCLSVEKEIFLTQGYSHFSPEEGLKKQLFFKLYGQGFPESILESLSMYLLKGFLERDIKTEDMWIKIYELFDIQERKVSSREKRFSFFSC
jgi:hypothetical protein